MKIIKNLLKLTLTLSLIFIILLGSIFVWASSPNHSPEEYNTLIKTDIKSSTSADSIYKIMTYNIGFFSGMTNNRPVKSERSLYDKNLENALNHMKTYDIDIACLQEVDFDSDRSYNINQQAELQKIGFPYACQAVNWDEKYLPFPGSPVDYDVHYGSVYAGQSILSKFPINKNERYILERPVEIPWHKDAFYLDRLIQEAELIIDGKEVTVLNIHLEAFDKDTRAKQINDLSKLIKDLIPEKAFILVGDFNSDINKENNCLVQILDIPGLAVASTGDQKESLTFPSDNPVKRIDYIFYNENKIEFKEASVLSDFGTVSDHLPVMMSFRLKS